MVVCHFDITTPRARHDGRKQGQRRAHNRGLTLVECMLAVALGLGVLSGAGQLLREGQTMQAQAQARTRLNQELRVAMTIITRDLRRAGHRRSALDGVALAPTLNVYRLGAAADPAASATSIRYSYSRDEGTDNNQIDTSGTHEAFGFDWAQGTLRTQVGGTWSALNDLAGMVVTNLQINSIVEMHSLGSACAAGGAGCCRPHPSEPTMCLPATFSGSTPAAVAPQAGQVIDANCPALKRHRFDVQLTGRAPAPHQAIVSTRQESVVVRNDSVDSVSCP